MNLSLTIKCQIRAQTRRDKPEIRETKSIFKNLNFISTIHPIIRVSKIISHKISDKIKRTIFIS